MKIYAIGDLHLSGKPPSKPMEIFGKHWTDHAAKVAANWHQLIRSDDTVIICGDTFMGHGSARRADRPELDRRPARAQNHSPGRKIILRGNHDYWWASLKDADCDRNNFSFLPKQLLPAARLPSAAVVAGLPAFIRQF